MTGLEDLVCSLATVIVCFCDDTLVPGLDINAHKRIVRTDCIDLFNNPSRDYENELSVLILKNTKKTVDDTLVLRFVLNEIRFLKFIIACNYFSHRPVTEHHVKDLTRMLIDFRQLLLTSNTQTHEVQFSIVKNFDSGDLSELDENELLNMDHLCLEESDDEVSSIYEEDLLYIGLPLIVSDLNVDEQKDEELSLPLFGLAKPGNKWCPLGVLLFEEVLLRLNVTASSSKEEIHAVADRLYTEHKNKCLVSVLEHHHDALTDALKEALLKVTELEKTVEQQAKTIREQRVVNGWRFGVSSFVRPGVATFFPVMPLGHNQLNKHADVEDKDSEERYELECV